MSDTKKDQLADLKRSRRQWEDDPDQHGPFPLEKLIADLRKEISADKEAWPSRRRR